MPGIIKPKLKPWPHKSKGPIFSIQDPLSGKTIFYRTLNNDSSKITQVVSEICLGERYGHIAPGKLFHNELYRGSTIDNWHGVSGTTLTELTDWILKANYPEYKYSLWMKKE